MHRQILFRFLFSAFAAFAIAVSASAQTQAGAIKAMRVQGDVIKMASNGTTAKVTEGQAIVETDTIITRAKGSVVLVFANGSSVRLAENSRLAIDEFKMDPLAQNIAVRQLVNEPTVSKTRLNLAYGDMVGNVKKLNSASSYDVKTPVGAAGVRGTTFRLVVRFDTAGQASFTLSTADGHVVFESAIQTTGGTGTIDVPAGTEVSATAQINVNTGVVTAVTVAPATPISNEAAQAITVAVTQAIEAAIAAATFTPADQSGSGTSQPPTQTGIDNASSTGMPAIPENPGNQRSPN
jgi:hypothetical protein